MTARFGLGGVALRVFVAGAAVSFGAGEASAQTVNYGYDALGRLITVNRSDGTSATYAYDPAGNRSQVVMAAPTPSVTPAAFDLGAPVTTAAGAWAVSAAPTITGITVAVPVSVVGGQYRINSGAWTTANGTVSAGQTVQVQAQAPGAPDASQTATLTVGGVSDTFQVTVTADTTPDAYDLGSLVSAASGAWAVSNTVTVAGINVATPISIQGGQYRINGGAWTTANGAVSAGQTVQVQAQAPGAAGATQTATLTVGGVSDTFQVTATADTTPDAYDLGTPVSAASGAWAVSNTVTVAGINATTPISIQGGQYRINGGAWTAANGAVSAGQTVQVQAQAPGAAGASQTATLTVGGVSDTFQVTATADTTPDAYDLGAAVSAASSTWAVSNTVTVAGINAAVPISIQGGQYRINGGAWTTANGTVSAGHTVQVQAQAPGAAGASQIATLTVGDVSDTFQVTTMADYTLDPITWPSISEASSSTNFVTGGEGRTLSGINSNVNLRGTITNLSGNLSAGSRLEMWVNGAVRYHSTNLGNGSWPGGEFAPGENVQFVARAVSADGAQRSGSYTVTVQNITTGQALGSFTVNQTAAAPDYTPDAFNDFVDQNAVTNDRTIWFGPAQTVTGINRPITLRVERYGYSGNFDEIYVNVYRDSGTGWIHQGSFDPRNGGYQYLDVTVNNGDKIHYAVDARTNEGRRTGTMNMVVWNLSQPGGSAQVSNRTANMTLDNDNNYPIRNIAPIDWDNGFFETNANVGAGATGYRTISGIEAPVTIRADIQNITGQGYTLADGGDFYIVSATRGNLASIPWRNGGSVSAVVQPGEQIRFYTDAHTSQGRRQFGFDVQVYNATTGAHIDHHYQSGILDADNNWNMGASVTLGNPNLYAMEYVARPGRAVTAQDSSTFSVAGGSGSWTAAVELQGVAGVAPVTSISGSVVTLKITSAVTRYSGGQFRIRITDASGTVSYSPWGNFALEIESGA